jgi:hypothetical protein
VRYGHYGHYSGPLGVKWLKTLLAALVECGNKCKICSNETLTTTKYKITIKTSTADGASRLSTKQRNYRLLSSCMDQDRFPKANISLATLYLPNYPFVRHVTVFNCFCKSGRWCHFYRTYMKWTSPHTLPTLCDTKRH